MPSNDVSTSAESPAPSAAAESVVDSTSEEPRSPASTTNRLLGTLVALASICICVLAEPVIMPVLVAILIGLVLAPAVRMLERWRIPRAIGALLAILFAVAIVGAVFAALATPAREWMDRAPRAMQRIEMTLKELRRPLQAATKATRGLDSLASIDEPARAQVRVVDTSPSLLAHAVRAAPGLVVGFIVTTVLAFVFLLHGDDLLRKFVTLAPHLRAKREIVLATRQAQHDLSLYMITITLINAGLGLATALALYLLGIPDPLLWGGAAALNYAPFVGPLVTSLVLAGAGFAESTSPLYALAPAGAFVLLHLVEGQIVTPHLVGRRLALDPVMVLLALLAPGWA